MRKGVKLADIVKEIINLVELVKIKQHEDIINK